MKKVILGIIITLLTICAVAEGLFIYKLKADENKVVAEQETENDDIAQNAESKLSTSQGERITVLKLYNSNEPYIDGYTLYGVHPYLYFNVIENMNLTAYDYHIPQIYLNSNDENEELSDDVKKINNEILQDWEKTIEEMEKSQELNYVKEGLNYTSYYNDNIMTLILITHTEDGSIIMKTYNIDTETGKQISNEELIQRYNFSEEEVKAKVVNSIRELIQREDYLKEAYANNEWYRKNADKAINEILEMSIDDVEIFIGNNDNLQMFIETFNFGFAGGDIAEFIFDLETGEEVTGSYIYYYQI